MKAKTKKYPKLYIVIAILLAFFIIGFIWISSVRDGEYVIIEEDRNNYCMNNSNTLVTPDEVEVKIPRANLEQYELEAKASGKCYRIISY